MLVTEKSVIFSKYVKIFEKISGFGGSITVDQPLFRFGNLFIT
jgi:hypothetical protein